MRFAASIPAAILVTLIGACTQEQPVAIEQDEQGEAEPQTAVAEPSVLEGTRWQVTAIDGEDVIDDSEASLAFEVEGALAGNTSCNRYFGNWSETDSVLSLAPAGVTMRACEETVMAQERRFLEALPEVVSFDIGEGDRIVFLDASGAERVSGVPEAPAPQDLAGSETSRFMCADAGLAELGFVGPDTISLNVAGQRYIMPSERAASGAKYSGDGAEFWNKGDEAVLTMGGQSYDCQRLDD
ncbi:MAG: META domain-containing protein [Pseudomonadota bacterium]